jgi:predicted nucleotidyltransferase
VVSFNDIRARRDDVIALAARHGAHNIRIFGSVARAENTPASDIDFLVTMDDDRSLLDHIAMIRELEDLFGCRVDVVVEDALDKYIRDYVLAEVKPL